MTAFSLTRGRQVHDEVAEPHAIPTENHGFALEPLLLWKVACLWISPLDGGSRAACTRSRRGGVCRHMVA